MDEDFFLIRKIKQGDEEAISRFVTKYYPRLLRYCHIQIGDHGYAEDLTQETFVRFFRSLEHYQHAGKAAAYLYCLARNLCRDYWKQPHMEEALDALPEPSTQPIDELELRLDLRLALDRLPEDVKETALLFFVQELRQREIAQILGISLPLVKYRISKARQLLQNQLRKEDFP